MTERDPLPPELQKRPFTTGDGLRAGLPRSRLQANDLGRPFHGVRVPLRAERSSPLHTAPDAPGGYTGDLAVILTLCRAYVPLLKPGQFFSHTTAARLWNAPLPSRAAPDEPLHVTSTPLHAEPRRAGVVGHRIDPALAHVTRRHGLPVADAPAAWLGLATLLPLDELVAAGDHLILDPAVLDPRDLRPHTTLDALRARVSDSHGRGVRLAASALQLVRQGSESRPETLVRLVLVRGGLPEPELNREIRDASGRFLGRGDMVYPAWRTLVEYDGDHHRSSASQYNRDITRIEQFVNEGWGVVRVRKSALFGDPADVVARVRRALMRGGWPG